MAARLRYAALALITAIVGDAQPRLAGAETRPSYGGDIVGSLLGEPASLDPVAAHAPADVAAVGLVFDTLYRIGPDGVVAPHLAAALPDVSGSTARIELRTGVTFHDGSALTAVDVVATLARVKASAAAGWLMAGVASVTLDGDTVVLDLAGSRKDLALILSAPQTAITPHGQAPPRGKEIGSGPFQVKSQKKDRLDLIAFDDHFAGRAYLDRVSLRWYATPTGEARAYETASASWSLRGATTFSGQASTVATSELESPATVLVYAGFGGGHADVTGNLDFRAAVDAALARGGLDSVGAGERSVPTLDPVPAELGGPALPDDARDSRLDAARPALERAGSAVRALSADRIAKLALEILIDQSRPDDREVAERVARALDKLGIAASIAAVSAPELAHRIGNGTCDLYIGQLTAAVPGPGYWFAQAYAVAGEREVADKLVAGGTVDLARVRAAFAKRLPIIPLFHHAVHAHLRSELRGAWFDGSARLAIADLFVWKT